MKSCCNISMPTVAAACDRSNPINAIKSIRFTDNDFKERYNMTFSKFLKLIKDQPDLSISIITDHNTLGTPMIIKQECTIKGGIYSVTFNIW